MSDKPVGAESQFPLTPHGQCILDRFRVAIHSARPMHGGKISDPLKWMTNVACKILEEILMTPEPLRQDKVGAESGAKPREMRQFLTEYQYASGRIGLRSPGEILGHAMQYLNNQESKDWDAVETLNKAWGRYMLEESRRRKAEPQKILMQSDIPTRHWPKRYISAVKDGSSYCMSCGKSTAKRKGTFPAPIRLMAGPIYISLCMTCAKQISDRLDVIIAAIEGRYGKL